MDDLSQLDFEELTQLADELPYGERHIQVYEECLRRVEKQVPNSELVINCLRLDYSDSLIMGGQLHRCPQVFSQVIDFYHRNDPNELPEYFTAKFGWQFRSYVQALADDPAISSAKLFDALAQMREFYLSQNDDMKGYYYLAYYVHKALGIEGQATEFRELWLHAPHSDFSECESCDAVNVVNMHSSFQDWPKAVEIGEETLAQPEAFCGAQPENLIVALLEPWLRTGQWKQAHRHYLSCLFRDTTDELFLEHHPSHFRYLGLVGAAGHTSMLAIGTTLFRDYVDWWPHAESASVLMKLAASAAFFLSQLPRQDQKLATTLPGSTMNWVVAPDVHNPTVAQAQQWCETIAMDLAENFDQREGMRYPHLRSEVKAVLNSVPVKPLPPEGLRNTVVHRTVNFFIRDLWIFGIINRVLRR